MPNASFADVRHAAGRGQRSSSGLPLTESTYAVSVSPATDLMAAASFASVGTVRPSCLLRRVDDDHAVAIGTQSREADLLEVISGKKRLTSPFS